MGFVISLLLTAVAVVICAYILPGVSVDGFGSAIIVALVLAVLNAVLKPILVVLTIPITILTLGLFLLVINVLIIYAAAALVGGFQVSGFFSALIFSILLSILNALLGGLIKA